MKRSSFQIFLIRAVVCALLHFGVILLVGVLLFYRYGFGHPAIRSLYEAGLGAGVVYVGLPDTVAGWGVNSVLYGTVAAAAITILRCVRHRVHRIQRRSADEQLA